MKGEREREGERVLREREEEKEKKKKKDELKNDDASKPANFVLLFFSFYQFQTKSRTRTVVCMHQVVHAGSCAGVGGGLGLESSGCRGVVGL